MTVIVEVVVPSAMLTEVGLALTVDLLALTAPLELMLERINVSRRKSSRFA